MEETKKITNIKKKTLPAEDWEIKIEAYRILNTLLCFYVVESASGAVRMSARVSIKGANTN